MLPLRDQQLNLRVLHHRWQRRILLTHFHQSTVPYRGWVKKRKFRPASLLAVLKSYPPPGFEQNPVTDNIGASDGTTGETTALTPALSKFTLHTDEAANRTSSIPDAEKKRINDAMSRADNDNPVPHSVLIIVKASVALATGQAPNGRMATTNRADPTSKVFAKFLEGLLLTAAGCGPQWCHLQLQAYQTTQTERG